MKYRTDEELRELRIELENEAIDECKHEHIATKFGRWEPLYDYCLDCGVQIND